MTSCSQVLDQVRLQTPMAVMGGKTSSSEQLNDTRLIHEEESSGKNRLELADNQVTETTTTANNMPDKTTADDGRQVEAARKQEQVAPSGLKKRDQKLRVVLPNEQKTLVTPTIIAGETTPSQLFNSLVQLSGQEVSLFTGLPTYTPGSADALATMNPFFWGVPAFGASSGELHSQVADSFMAAAGHHQVMSQKQQQQQQQQEERADEPGKLGGEQMTPDSNNPTRSSCADRRPSHKFSFDHMPADSDNNGFQYILASPYLFLSPEHDALLRLGLSNHLQQHPLANKTAPPSQLTATMALDTPTPAGLPGATLSQPVAAYISNRSSDDSMLNQNQQPHNVYHQQQQQQQQQQPQQQQQQQYQQQQHDQIHISAKDLTNQVVAHQHQRGNIIASSSISTGKPTAPATTLSYNEAKAGGPSPSPYLTYQQSQQLKANNQASSNHQQQQQQQQYTLASHRPLQPRGVQLNANDSNKIFAQNGNFQANQVSNNNTQVPRSQLDQPISTPQYIYHQQPQQLEAARHNPALFSNHTSQAGKPTEDGLLKVAGPPMAHHQHSPLLVMSSNEPALVSSTDYRQAQNIAASIRPDGALAMHYDSTARPLYDDRLRRLYLVQQHQRSVLQPVSVGQCFSGVQSNGQPADQPALMGASDNWVAQNEKLVKQQAAIGNKNIQSNGAHQVQLSRDSVSSSNSLSGFGGISSPRRPDQSSSACSSVSRDATIGSIDVTAIPSRASTLDGTQSDGSTVVASSSSFKGASKTLAACDKFNGKSVVATAAVAATMTPTTTTTTTTMTTMTTTAMGADGVAKKKSKGGRKKKPVTHEELMARKNRCKERNRVAAKRCRQKRKQFLDELHGRIDELNNLNKKLQRENTMLKGELELLRKQQLNK